jgi:protein-L-isoaspartate(D-aspartate) O-methyltransferase
MSDRPTDAATSEAERVAIADFLLRLRRIGITDRRLVSAIESVPRQLFVPPGSRRHAYAERALPIECGQTISAPELVAQMTAALEIEEGDKVLEIGTGTGYQTAILARLAAQVFTIDRFRTLVETAQSRFRTLKLANIVTRVDDGSLGWLEKAPFDRIMVTAAADEIPHHLIEQLRTGGVMVIPVGPADRVQRLLKIVRTEDGFDTTRLAEVRFVPLISGTAEHL